MGGLPGSKPVAGYFHGFVDRGARDAPIQLDVLEHHRATPFSAMERPAILPHQPHRLSAARVAFQSTIIEEGNWKLVWENNRECYHCASNHPELARTYPDTPTITSVTGAADDPRIAEHWRRCESAALRPSGSCTATLSRASTTTSKS